MLYKLLDGFYRAWIKCILVPGLKSSFKSCGAGVMLGRRLEVAGVDNISIGHDVYLGSDATSLTTRAEIRIGDWVMSAPSLTTVTGDHRIDALDHPMMTLLDDDKLPENDQDVIIGNDVLLGCGVAILKGVYIADHCVIAACAVVTKYVLLPYSVWGVLPV